MRLRTFVADTVAGALRQVQQELGPNALVLETRTEGGSTEVIAAEVERERPSDGLMRLRAEVALLRRELSSGARTEPPANRQPAVQPRLAKMARRLLEQDLRPDLVTRILKMIARAPASEGDPLDPQSSDYCRNAVAGQVPGVRENGGKQARCFAFVGPPGAGKSTTIAKLAEQSRQSEKRGQRRMGLLTLDGGRPGGGELLKACAERLGLPFLSVQGADDVGRAISELGQMNTILVDTAGLGFRDNAALNVLRERLHRPNQLAIHLVLPAHLESDAGLAMATSFRPLFPAAVVFTKIDETERYGNLINIPAALDLPVAALCYGRVLTDDLAPATRAMIADLLLGRRTHTLELKKA